jgi:hypothetical protein
MWYSPERMFMERIKALSRGTKLVLAAGPILLFSLFFNWQMLKIDYGPAGVASMPQDGWDAWGLLLAMLVSSDWRRSTLRRIGIADVLSCVWRRRTAK